MIPGTFKLDQKAADTSEAELRITETGAYVGTIVQADIYESRGGATFVRFYFRRDDGAIAWVQQCIFKTDGSESFGFGIFHAVMACAGISGVTTQAGKVRTPSGTIVGGHRMRELESKRVGLLLVAEPREYRDQSGAIKVATDLILKRPFEASSGRTSKEMAAGSEPKRITSDLKYAQANPRLIRRLDGASGGYASTAAASPAAHPASTPAGSPNLPPAPPPEDDVPF